MLFPGGRSATDAVGHASSSSNPMNVIIFGATGMVGQGALRECLLDPRVQRVVAIGRAATGRRHAKLRDLVVPDLFDLTAIESELTGMDACFFSLGASAAGMNEQQYARVNHDLPLAVARTLVRLNPAMTFIYVSGTGTDSTERGRTMWARVKGRTENALLRLPFKAAYMFRPALIVPMHGIKSRTAAYRIFYTVLGPLLPLIKRLVPGYVTTTERLGQAMISVAAGGFPKRVLENPDINRA